MRKIWLPGSRKLAVVLSSVVAAAGCLVALVATPALAQTAIAVNGASAGRTFDGVGAISGGGGNSRLLTDYPAAAAAADPGLPVQARLRRGPADPEGGDRRRHQLHRRLGVEHRAHRGSVNCNAGYEFWLMEQAKARNPNIKLYGLAWGAPGWIGGGFWSTDTINYLVSWLNCAKSRRADDQLPRRLERARLQHLLVRAAALHAERRRLLRRADRRRRQRLERRQRHRRQLRLRQRGLGHRHPLPLRAATAAPPTAARPTRPPNRPASRCGPARTARRT